MPFEPAQFVNIQGGLSTSVRCFYLVVGAEDVEGQRFLSLVDEVDGLVYAASTQDGQKGSKDLFLHDLCLGLHIS